MQRCRAKSKRSGEQCKNYALKDWGVCRMHGARGGPKTKKGLLVCKKSSLTHGMYSQGALEEKQFIKNLIKNGVCHHQ